MENFNREEHWQNIYNTKSLEEVSWYQSKPTTSLNYIKEFDIPLSAGCSLSPFASIADSRHLMFLIGWSNLLGFVGIE